jgi:hypothetical protein
MLEFNKTGFEWKGERYNLDLLIPADLKAHWEISGGWRVDFPSPCLSFSLHCRSPLSLSYTSFPFPTQALTVCLSLSSHPNQTGKGGGSHTTDNFCFLCACTRHNKGDARPEPCDECLLDVHRFDRDLEIFHCYHHAEITSEDVDILGQDRDLPLYVNAVIDWPLFSGPTKDIKNFLINFGGFTEEELKDSKGKDLEKAALCGLVESMRQSVLNPFTVDAADAEKVDDNLRMRVKSYDYVDDGGEKKTRPAEEIIRTALEDIAKGLTEKNLPVPSVEERKKQLLKNLLAVEERLRTLRRRPGKGEHAFIQVTASTLYTAH